MNVKKKESEEILPLVESLLKEGKEVEIIPQGISMLPTIKGGEDTVTLVPPSSLKKAEIVLVRHEDKYILHRILRLNKKKEEVTLLGDNNIDPEKDIPFSEVIGKVTTYVHNGKRKKAYGCLNHLRGSFYSFKRFLRRVKRKAKRIYG